MHIGEVIVRMMTKHLIRIRQMMSKDVRGSVMTTGQAVRPLRAVGLLLLWGYLLL